MAAATTPPFSSGVAAAAAATNAGLRTAWRGSVRRPLDVGDSRRFAAAVLSASPVIERRRSYSDHSPLERVAVNNSSLEASRPSGTRRRCGGAAAGGLGLALLAAARRLAGPRGRVGVRGVPWRTDRGVGSRFGLQARANSSAAVAPRAQGVDYADRAGVTVGDKPNIFVAPPVVPYEDGELPRQSADGGNEAEFQEYWRCNRAPRRLEGGWLERRTHPQVNVKPFWYNEKTGDIVFTEPEAAEEAAFGEHSVIEGDGLDIFSGSGPEWEMKTWDLKRALFEGRQEELGLDTDKLAQRALAEYEAFEPRVLSWHDFQNLTFWFFGGMGQKQSKGSFFKKSGGGGYDNLFAPRQFFVSIARLAEDRLHRLHPICLTYLVWTFVRAEVQIRGFMEKVGDHCVKGHLQMMDRCSLGTMVWNFGKLRVRHDVLFEEAAREICRPNRVRSLAPRNFQNIVIAFTQRRHYNHDVFSALTRGMQRQLDNHRPHDPKLARDLVFAYTCKDGSEVLADSFRVNSCSVIMRFLRRMQLGGPDVESMLSSMLDYATRSVTGPQNYRVLGKKDLDEFAQEFLAYLREIPELSLPKLPHKEPLDKFLGSIPKQIEGELRERLGVMQPA